MAFNFNMLSSDNFGFDFGGDNQNGSVHDSNFLAFDIQRLHRPYLTDTSSFQLYGNASGSYGSTLNRMNTILTRQRHQVFGADVQQQNMSYFTTITTTAVEQPPVTVTATLPHGGQFGVVVQRRVVETVTYRPIPPQPLSRVSYTSPNYCHPKNSMPTEIKADDVDDHDVKPRILHLPPTLPQNNNNNDNNSNNSTYPLQIEGKNKIKMPEQDEDNDKKDDFGHKNRTDEYKTRSLKHKKYGPYTCPRCERKIATSQSFASHMRSHYSSETEEERKMRIEAKYKKKNLRVAISGDGLTLLPHEMD